MTSFHLTGDALWQRMERAVEKIQERLERTAKALEQAGVPYAIIGGNAVRAWVAQADEAAVRTTRDVDILLRRSDWPGAVPCAGAWSGFSSSRRPSMKERSAAEEAEEFRGSAPIPTCREWSAPSG